MSQIITEIRKNKEIEKTLAKILKVRGIEAKVFLPLTFSYQLGTFLEIINSYNLNIVVYDLGYIIHYLDMQNCAYDNLGSWLWLGKDTIIKQYKISIKPGIENASTLDDKRKSPMVLYERACFEALKIITQLC